MQQNNYIEAEEAYRRALLLAPDNNKMCNLGICLMKQGRIGEAKDTLRRVKPAVADGPRGMDSHLKAYERAQQMLRDLESEMMNKGGDRVEQRRLFDAFLGSSAIWQPHPCKESSSSNSGIVTSNANVSKFQDDAVFADENVNSTNIMVPSQVMQKSLKPNMSLVNSLSVDAPPFYSSKIGSENSVPVWHERLKRTRSLSVANVENKMPFAEPEQKMRKQSISPEKEDLKWADFLPDNKDFEEAIIAAVLGESKKAEEKKVVVDKRLKVFQDITLSLSPKA